MPCRRSSTRASSGAVTRPVSRGSRCSSRSASTRSSGSRRPATRRSSASARRGRCSISPRGCSPSSPGSGSGSRSTAWSSSIRTCGRRSIGRMRAATRDRPRARVRRLALLAEARLPARGAGARRRPARQALVRGGAGRPAREDPRGDGRHRLLARRDRGRSPGLRGRPRPVAGDRRPGRDRERALQPVLLLHDGRPAPAGPEPGTGRRAAGGGAGALPLARRRPGHGQRALGDRDPALLRRGECRGRRRLRGGPRALPQGRGPDAGGVVAAPARPVPPQAGRPRGRARAPAGGASAVRGGRRRRRRHARPRRPRDARGRRRGPRARCPPEGPGAPDRDVVGDRARRDGPGRVRARQQPDGRRRAAGRRTRRGTWPRAPRCRSRKACATPSATRSPREPADPRGRRHVPVHRHRGLDPPAHGDRRRGLRRGARRASRARRGGGRGRGRRRVRLRGRRRVPRVLVGGGRRSGPPSRRSARSRPTTGAAARSGPGWASTRARCSSSPATTWASRSTARPASRPPRTAARSS